VKLYPQVDRQKGTLRIEVQIEKPDDLLWPDMSARITFLAPLATSDGARPGVLVPRNAIRGTPDAPFVWTVRAGSVTRVDVALGNDFADRVQVMRGLDGGETVIVGNPPDLRDGQHVTVARTP
jgi:multidrug efflux pump subunit AcrA (membrane-fusion protein)